MSSQKSTVEYRTVWECTDGRSGVIPESSEWGAQSSAKRLNDNEYFTAHIERRTVTEWEACSQ